MDWEKRSVEVFWNVIGGFIVAAIIYLYELSKKIILLRRLKVIFGSDFMKNNKYHIVYAKLRLNPCLAGIEMPYVKATPDGSSSGAVFGNISFVVGSNEFRASNYLTNLFASFQLLPILADDAEMRGKSDFSRVSLGGVLSSYKSEETFGHLSNRLIKMENGNKFVSVSDSRTIVQADKVFDYGIIIKITPANFRARTWIACAGFGEWGTSGAAWYLCNKWKDIYWKCRPNFDFWGTRQEPYFAALIRVKPGNDESAELVQFFKSPYDVIRYCEKEGLGYSGILSTLSIPTSGSK